MPLDRKAIVALGKDAEVRDKFCDCYVVHEVKRSVGGRFAIGFFASDQLPDQLWRVGQRVNELEIRFVS